MARRKIRKHLTVEQVKDIINEWFRDNYDEVIDYLLCETGFDDIKTLRDFEYKGGTGLDCGWVWLTTRNEEQHHEWLLDNGKYDAYVTCIRCPYDSQSTKLKRLQVDYALYKTGLNFQYKPYVRLD